MAVDRVTDTTDETQMLRFTQQVIDETDGGTKSVKTLRADFESNYAQVKEEMKVVVDANSATASKITELETKVGDNDAKVTELTSSVDGIKGKWSVTIDVNGHMTGVELIGGADSGELIIDADVLVNGSLTADKISSKAVGTEKIADNAITDIVAAYTADVQTAGTSTTFQQATITTEGEPVVVMFSMYIERDTGGTSELSIVRDSTVVWTSSPRPYAPDGLASAQLVDIPPSGTHTYYMRLTRATSTGSNRTITLIRMKR